MKIATTIIIITSIFFISIGYSALNTNVTISGEAVVETLYDIKITNITISSSENDGYLTYNPIFTDNTTNTSVTLPNENSTIKLIIEVTNNTNNYYHLDKIEELLNSNPAINYEIKDKELIYFHPKSITEIEISFSYKFYSATSKYLNLNLNYTFERITYKNLDYVIFSGYEYINTGLSNTGDYIFETEFNQTAFNYNHTDSSVGGWIISGRVTGNYTLGVFNGNYGVYNGYGAITSAKSPKISLNTWYPLYFSRFKHTIGTYNYTVNGGLLIPAEYETEIRIGGATGGYSTGPDNRHFIGSIKHIKITNAATNEVLRYYIPAEIIEGTNIGEVGYWDIINDIFISNGGTGEFIAP